MLVDRLDRRILEALKRDARTSYRKIAQMMGVTTPTVIARIKKLVEMGIIEGYSVKVRGEPFDGVLFIISGRKARSLRKRMERVEGVKNVMTTSDGALLVLADPRATGTVRKDRQGGRGQAEGIQDHVTDDPPRHQGALRVLQAADGRGAEDHAGEEAVLCVLSRLRARPAREVRGA